MSGDLIISLCLNDDRDFVDSFQIPYDITWPDLEAMLKAQFDAERLSVTYIDSDNDEVSIGSQEELFEAFRVAMKAKNTLQLKVMTLAAEAAVFRMPDEGDFTDSAAKHTKEPEELQEPFELREVCPDPRIPIPMPDKPAPGRVDEAELSESEVPEGGETQPGPLTIVMPDCKQKVTITKDSVQWQKPEVSDTEGEEEADTGDQPLPLEIVTPPRARGDTEESLSSHKDQQLAYSDFVFFMTKLKKELRCEIVRDVTRKTVKQVLKGLDGAVIESLQGSSLLQGAAPGQGATKKDEHPVYVHDGVFCDSCNNVIVGPRYKCGNCLDFDLCESCEAKPGVHTENHVFVKIRRPCYRVGVQDGTRKPLLRTEIYKVHRKPITKLVVPILGEPTENENEINFRLESKMKDMFARNEDKRRKKDEKKLEKLKWKAEKLKRRMECRSDPPLKRERLDILAADDNTVTYDFYKVMMGAEVLECLNIPDGTSMQPDTKFTKTWRVKNSGDGPWSESTKLKLLWGNLPVPEPEQDVPHLKPGEDGEITVACISPPQPGDYQSHWKLYEHGMGFGARIWCSIVVVPRETLEPTSQQNDSLKVVTETMDKQEVEDVIETAPENLEKSMEKLEITFKPTPEEHLREVAVKREDSQGSSLQEEKEGTGEQDVADGSLRKKVITSQLEAEDCGEPEVKEEDRDDQSENGEGYVMYVKSDLTDVYEVEESKETKKIQESIADDLTTAVARLTLENEVRTGAEVASHTATPHNTPYDLTPMKTPNPEPEEAVAEEGAEPLQGPLTASSSSSVELVPSPEEEEEEEENPLTIQRMASLDLKPDIDLMSVSSYSDDDDEDDSSLSDSDYIIVPLPECFDLSKPLNQSFSSYSASLDRTVSSSLDIHAATKGSRVDSVDDLFNTSVNLPTRPLSPSPTSMPSFQQEVASANQHAKTDTSATSQAAEVKGDKSDDIEESGPQVAEMQTSEPAQDQTVEKAVAQAMADNSPGSSSGDAGVSSPGDTVPPEEGSSESGAASAQKVEAGPKMPGEATAVEPEEKKPSLDNVDFIKASKQKGPPLPPKMVDFAPEFANQLVTTAVSAAGQALITAKAVFKTWQDNSKADTKSQSKVKSASFSGKSSPPTGWKPASTQYAPPKDDDWKPEEPKFKQVKSQWKPPVQDFKPPKSNWKPPVEPEGPAPKQWTPPDETEAAAHKQQWVPPEMRWTPAKESGPMGQLFEMGFFDRKLNQELLNQFKNDLPKVIQELLARKNADWSV